MAKETASSSTGSGGKQASGSSLAGHVAEQGRDRVDDVTDKVKGVGGTVSSSADDLKDRATGVLADAKEKVSDAGAKVTDALEGQKTAGADRAKGFSDALRRAAGELEHEVPPAAAYINRAADEIDHMAEGLKRRDVRQILGDVQDFAKRQPAAFLGATVLGGFALMRLLKTPTVSDETAGGSSQFHEAASRAQSTAKGTALVPTGSSSPGDKPITGGAGNHGGSSPKAPGFDFKPGGSSMEPGGR